MRFTLPSTTPASVSLGQGFELEWTGITGSGAAVECGFFFPITGMASADGNTVEDSFLALFADEMFSDAVLPADVAAALDELAHQAVRVVCDRLSGGMLDSATFADVPEGYVGHLCADDEEVECDEETLEDIEQRFLKLLAEDEPDHPWVCKLRTPREGNHPRSKEFVLR